MARNGTSRLEAASGFVFVALFVIAFSGFLAPDIPSTHATAPEWQSYFVAHQDRIQAGLGILCVMTLAFLWFLGSVRARLGTAEGGDRRLTSIAYGGGIGLVVFSFFAITATAVAAYRPGDTNAEVTQAFNDFALLAPGGRGDGGVLRGDRDHRLPPPSVRGADRRLLRTRSGDGAADDRDPGNRQRRLCP
jgi:hypothetical protein